MKFYKFYIAAAILIFLGIGTNCQEAIEKNFDKIIIEGEVPSNIKPKVGSVGNVYTEMDLYVTAINIPSIYPDIKTMTEKVLNHKIKWIIPSTDKIIFNSEYFGTKATLFLLSPGDSIYVKIDEQLQRSFSGRGAEKCNLLNEIEILKKGLLRPVKRSLDIKTLEEYLKLNKFLDEQLALVMPHIESYKSRLTAADYNWIKAHTIENIEIERVAGFEGIARLYTYFGPEGSSTLTQKDLTTIWDSTQYKSWAIWLRKQANYHNGGFPYYICSKFNRQESWRKFGFYLKHDSLNSSSVRRIIYYNNAKKNFSGLMRERALAYIVANEVIKELLNIDQARVAILKDYYKQPGFAEYKHLVKDYETKSLAMKGGKWAPDFTLTDTEGKCFVKQNLKGKTVVMDFWFTGCNGCKQLTPKLREVEQAFDDDTNVVFVSVSVDKDKQKWLKSLKQEGYKLDNAINLYTGGEGTNNPIVKDYNIISYPTLFLIGPDSNATIVTHPVPDPRKDDGKALIGLIRKVNSKLVKENIATLYDGPYVIYRNDSIIAYSIDNDKVFRKVLDKSNPVITAQTDLFGKTFDILLKTKLENEASEYPQPPKVLAISDIEGNFDAFRKLLVGNKVIDEQFNWTFGKGHLVLNGDFFDRGNQVTECLWLIYSLEEKAKSQGGYVHYILGNHEIMNLQGDYRYTQQKYIDNVGKMGLKSGELFDENSELGKWLRTKNIMEKIGNVLYVHGGVSPQVNRLPLSIIQINNLARPYYAGNIDSANKELVTLFDSRDAYPASERPSPFWFRGYYNGESRWKSVPTHEQVDSTLIKFGISKIVTGHTIVNEAKITNHYNGKVINIDTKHAKRAHMKLTNKSAALLIDDSKYYNVDIEGKKEILFEPLKASVSKLSE